jgi:hypothetical protein
MLQRLKEHWFNARIERDRAINVSFTGGLGAQILSTAIYYHFVDRGYRSLADLSYFSNTHRIATPGEKGQISYWTWEMDCYCISRDSLTSVAPGERRVPTLHDGAMKFSLGLEALESPGVRAHFDTATNDQYSSQYRTSELQGDRYLCVHVRRGDYLNVASHLVSSRALDDIAAKFATLVDRVLILSDSPIGAAEFETVRSKFPGRLHVIDSDPDPILAHSLMRNATVLICSNSQFSLSAGLLSEGLKVIPKVWFGADAKRLNQAIDTISDFVVVR